MRPHQTTSADMIMPTSIARYLRERKRPGPPRRVWLWRQGFFLEEECWRAFIRLGLEVRQFHLERTWDAAAVSRFLQGVAEFLPDFFFSVNHIGFDQSGWLSQFLEASRRPAVSWYVDHPHFILRDFRGNVSPWVLVLVWDRHYVDSLQEMGFVHVKYLPLAADTRLFRPYRRAPVEKFGSHPAAFVGSTWRPRLEQQMAKFQRDPEKLAAIAAGARLFRTSGHYRARDDLARVYPGFAALPGAAQIELEAAALWQASVWDRLDRVGPLTRLGLRVFGDPAWRDCLPLAHAYGGPLHYHRELPAFYQCVAVNLNVTSLQMKNGLNQRVFDVPAAGAFLLTEAREALWDIYHPEDIATYAAPEEAPEKLVYYLNQPEARRRLAAKSRARVLDGHTYIHRGQAILQWLASLFS